MGSLGKQISAIKNKYKKKKLEDNNREKDGYMTFKWINKENEGILCCIL